MLGGQVSDIVRRAEHLLWVVARCDVEGLSSARDQALLSLRELEKQAAGLHATDLYREVFENAVLNQ